MLRIAGNKDDEGRNVRVPAWARTAGALLSATLLTTACSTSPTAQGGPAPTELRLAIGGESEDGYDPTLGWGRYGSPLFQSTLLGRDADLNLTNDLATGHSVSPDGLVWTVDLRTDARFSDGQPVTAKDVAYTFTTAAKSGGLTDVTVLKEAVVVDEDTVELRLTQPQSTFVNRLVSLGIVPEHAHGADYARKPVGSGPFVLEQWDEGQQLIVKRNDAYYGQKPAFERVVFVFTGEDATLAAARSGQVHVASLPSSLARTELPGMALRDVDSVDNRGISFPYLPAEGRTTAEGRPIGNAVTSDRAVRQAVNYALDRQALVDGVLDGFGSPATGPVDGMPWFEPSAAIEDNDPERARKLLDEAGWTDSDGDGVRERAGVKAEFPLLYPASDSLRQGLALAVVDMLKPIGIAVSAQGESWEVIRTRMHAEPVLFGWGSHDPTEMHTLYSSARAGVELWNPGFYANPAVDAHLDAAMATTDPEVATREWKAAQFDGAQGFSAQGDAAWAWLVNLKHTYFANQCLDLGPEQVEPHGHGWPVTWNIAAWRWTC
ncbi:nickel ABC transporter substrate-binding protein [Actinosynnema pretiosum]|uniref:Nickel ABC transporter substrate-binding protein n=1 Tax=Actinosynnema pretiosum TaxID=42197 RepID=A0A290Z694_9PSEU|nr:nickel ABC transporter substrate-binding protein [Actinosynnema pretiosum]